MKKLLLLTTCLFPAAAAAETAWVWGNDASAPSYEADAKYASNPGGGAVAIKRTGTGAYEVSFAGLAKMAGSSSNVQVAAYGAGPELCKVEGWSPRGADFVARVLCFKGAAAADSRFSVLVNTKTEAPAPKGPAHAWAWADKPDAASYAADARYSSGGASIKRSGTGAYDVSFAGLHKGKGAGGNVQVTAYGPGADACKVVSWQAAGDDFMARVACFNAAGAAADTRFSILVIAP